MTSERPSRWRRVKPNKPNEQTIESRPFDMEVVSTDLDYSSVKAQLRHARQQQELAATYPGRPPRPMK
jgi:hypothetical protein